MIARLQTNNGTFFGRYYTETRLLQDYVKDGSYTRILSFGCSTGEELMFMRNLFPQAQLAGCDIDAPSLEQARRQLADDVILFDSSRHDPADHGPFDLILCNSVLLSHTVQTPDGPRGLSADLWLDAVSRIGDALRPGGVLQIINSNFPFRLHPCASDYRPLRSPLVLGPNFVDMFGLDGKLLCRGVRGTGFSAIQNVHRAGPGWRSLDPCDFTDVHFRKAGGSPVEEGADEASTAPDTRAVIASGRASYRPEVAEGAATWLEVDVEWQARAGDAVHLARTVRRTWFDGSMLPEQASILMLEGRHGAAFIESMIGRPSTALSLPYGWDEADMRRSPFF